MPYYESVYIARPDISTAQVDALTENLTSIVGDNGGTVTKNEYWGLKHLAYRIKKNRKGPYTLMNIDAPAGAISELERLGSGDYLVRLAGGKDLTLSRSFRKGFEERVGRPL